jgi:peptidoglycan/LPS O-acetylase OafA/YrhL
MHYRPEIDGLRALAVLPVILFHAGVPGFGGGYVGVDVFFVISGYLITSIIVADLQAGQFSLVRFYERRVRRILPALCFVAAACIPFAWRWMLPDQLKDFWESLGAVAVFASNVLFWRESGYFDSAAELKPLLHTWSLAVEEQYYLLFPLLMLGTWRFGRRAVALLVLTAGAASLALAQRNAFANPDAGYFLLPSRAWELALGALTALLLAQRSPAPVRTGQAQWAAALSVMLIASAVVWFDAGTPFPGLYALLPTLGAAGVILFASPATLAGRLLGSAPLVGVGLVSYSAYIWHQPLLAFARHASLEEPGPALLLALGLALAGLSYLTWRFVERPFRQAGTFDRRAVFLGAALVSVLFFSAGIAGHLGHLGNPLRTPDWLVNTPPPKRFVGILVRGDNCSARDPMKACVLGDPAAARRLVIVGDSHARVLTEPASAGIARHGYSLVDLSSSGCPFLPGLDAYVKHKPQRDCHRGFQRRRLDYLLSLPPSTVVLHSRLPLYIAGVGFDNKVGGVESKLYYMSTRARSDERTRRSEIGASFERAVAALVAHGHQMTIVGPVPTQGWDPMARLYRIEQMGLGDTHEARRQWMDVPRRAVDQYHRAADAIIESIAARHPQVKVLDPRSLLCDAAACASITAQRVLYADADHLSTDGAQIVFDALMRQLGWAPH